jgi:hypothetical protein
MCALLSLRALLVPLAVISSNRSLSSSLRSTTYFFTSYHSRSIRYRDREKFTHHIYRGEVLGAALFFELFTFGEAVISLQPGGELRAPEELLDEALLAPVRAQVQPQRASALG